MKRIPKAWQYQPREVYQIRIARWFAGLKGYYIDRGNWVRAPSGTKVAQGWGAFYAKYRPAINALIWGEEAAVECGDLGKRLLERLEEGAFTGGRRKR